MSIHGCQVSVFVAALYAFTSFASAQDSNPAQVRWDSTAKRLHVRLGDPAVSLTVEQRWFLRNGANEVSIEDIEAQPVRKVSENEIAWVEQSKSAAVRWEYSFRAKDEITCSVRIVQSGQTPVALRWQQEISGLPMTGPLFAPSQQGVYPLAERDVTVAYRGSGDYLSIPMATLLDEKTDLGITIAARLAMPVAGFQVQTDRSRGIVTLNRTIPGIDFFQTCDIQHYLVRHAGDWRPGLGWVRDKFPKFFMLSAPQPSGSIYGAFAYSHEADEKLLDQWVREGVRNLEIHFTFPHLGKYFPDEQPWIKAMDDKWAAVKKTTDPAAPKEDASYDDIKRYMSKVVESRGNFESIRQFIGKLKARGIRTYYYIQATELWEPYINTYFKDAILRHPDGRPRLSWYEHVLVDCRPETALGREICRQMEQLLDALPEMDGFFMDQSALDREDYSVCRITDRLARIAEARGKILYWNGPHLVELAEHTVGMLAEAGAEESELIKYLTIGNKVCCGMGAGEHQYQRNLLNGLWPSAPSQTCEARFRYKDDPATVVELPKDLEDCHRRYMYLYQLYPGKVWYLGAHALKVPQRVQANIFQRPNGDYLVPVIVPGRTFRSAKTDLQVPLQIRIPDAAAVKGVYARTPETPAEQYAVPWKLADGALEVTLPWLRSACLVWISKEHQPSGAFPAPPQADPATPEVVSSPIMHACIAFDGIVPTGAVLDVKTSAPLPPPPVRKCSLNGRPIGNLKSWNYRSWKEGGAWIELPADILPCLKPENELVIESAGPQDFFALRNARLTIVFADGRQIAGQGGKETYSSCAGPLTEGIIGSPLRIKICLPNMESSPPSHDIK